MLFVGVATEVLSDSMLSIVVYPVHVFDHVQIKQKMLEKSRGMTKYKSGTVD